MISVIIPTLNEESDLPGCLESVSWCDDVHVFDSFSTDRTTQIAEASGAQVVCRKFDNYASQRNAALSLPAIRHAWILFLDADERIPSLLAQEMLQAVARADLDVDAFRLRRRDHFMGRWLKHAQLSPFYVRLFRRGVAHYERDVNEVVRVPGRIVDLSFPFDHYPFSKGLAHWIDKHNRYSSLEARCSLATRRGEVECSVWRALVAKDFNERRFHQKELFYRLPARPLIKLLYMLILRRAILDGVPGIRYALLQMGYEWMIVLKAHEADVQQAQVSKAKQSPVHAGSTAIETRQRSLPGSAATSSPCTLTPKL